MRGSKRKKWKYKMPIKFTKQFTTAWGLISTWLGPQFLCSPMGNCMQSRANPGGSTGMCTIEKLAGATTAKDGLK